MSWKQILIESALAIHPDDPVDKLVKMPPGKYRDEALIKLMTANPYSLSPSMLADVFGGNKLELIRLTVRSNDKRTKERKR